MSLYAAAESVPLQKMLRQPSKLYNQPRLERQDNMENQNLTPMETWQTHGRGDNDSEYQIYTACAESLGWTVKSYDEWLQS